ncbi:MAG: aldolase [Geodermatophilaceae bacterium]|nr:aldolase [Geodermatophilaceae bacterium]
MSAVLGEELYAELDQRLAGVDRRLVVCYPGEVGGRQPVHTVYVPADRVTPDLPARYGAAALALLAEHDLAGLADELGFADAAAYERMLAKLAREPIEDLRVDVEDGYGHRPDDEEDAAVVGAAAALATGVAPPYWGLRFKSLEPATRRRGVRSLDLFVGAVLRHGPLPDGFVVTLPKVTSVDQVTATVVVCERLEEAHGLPEGRLRFELQIETPQSVLGADGTATVARMIHAAAGRCSGLHYGTYDYSAACGVAAAHQSMEHPAADHAKAVMQVAAAGTGVRLSDGSTNLLPVGDRAAVRRGWAEHLRLVRRSLERGFYQGWDLHPGQLPTRYLATYSFFRAALPAAAQRLRTYLDQSVTAVLDEPATAQALAAVIVRGLECGAIDDDEVAELTGSDRVALDRLMRRSPR